MGVLGISAQFEQTAFLGDRSTWHLRFQVKLTVWGYRANEVCVRVVVRPFESSGDPFSRLTWSLMRRQRNLEHGY
jgi:hypothetical protein